LRPGVHLGLDSCARRRTGGQEGIHREERSLLRQIMEEVLCLVAVAGVE
jgi:hypothetical protein